MLLSQCSDPPLPKLAAAIARDLRERIARGEPARVEDYLERFPALRNDPELLADVIYAEYCARRNRGERPTLQTYGHRFPSLQNSLARLFCLHSMLASSPDALSWLERVSPKLPEPGQRFLDFELIRLLGQGAFARVFLARQQSLANRLVVVKVTSGPTHEHETLAQLSHPHIVPIYSVHRDPETSLTAICMPYQGAVSMASVAASWSGGPLPRSASAWVEGARQKLGDLPPPNQVPAWPEPFPAGRSFVYACAWLMKQAALALDHAHRRHVFHLDLKPSNLLITAEGQPLLVDFNLSWACLADDGHRTLVVGGTLPYMPPEQIEALRRQRRDDGQQEAIGAHTDVFSLAATFYELLTGKLPFGAPDPADNREKLLDDLLASRQKPPTPLKVWNPDVPDDLDDLLLRCLAPDPQERPPSAAALAAELDDFVQDRVIRSYHRARPALRMRRFLRRNRHRLAAAAISLAVATATGIGTWVAVERLQPVQRPTRPVLNTAADWFWHGVRSYNNGQDVEAVEALQRALELGYQDPDIVYLYLGLAYARLDRDQEAIRAYTRALELNPQQPFAYIGRCLLYIGGREGLRDYDKAVEDALKAWELIRSDTSGQVPASWIVELARCFALLARSEEDAREAERLRGMAAELVLLAHQKGMSRQQIEAYVARHDDRALEEILRRDAVAQRLMNE